MDEKKNRNGNESGQPVRAAPFHGKKKYTARLYRKKSKDLSGLGKSVTDSVVQKQVVQNEEQETKAENEKLSSELLDAGKLSADRGRNLVRRTVIRRKKYSDRSKKLKKRENDADGLQRLKFENETVKNGKSNQKEQVKHFWKKKRQIRAFKESGNTIYETGTAGNVTLSNTKKLKGMLKRVFSGSKRTKMAVFSIGLIFFLLITSLGSCSSVIQGVGALVISTTYPSSDEVIYAVENHYKELEASLNQQINEMEKKHPGYEEYRYQIDEITHNPYHLISYLTAKYGEFTYEEVKAIYDKYYADEKFVRVLGEGVCPETKWVEGSNYVDINFKIDPRTNRIIMMGAIDNLVKGAAGQAVQNMNLMFGLPETEGLELVPMFP